MCSIGLLPVLFFCGVARVLLEELGELLEELCWILEEVRGILEDKRIWGGERLRSAG